MTDKAITKLTYEDLKFIKTRKVFQAVFEGPIEDAAKFIDMFGAPIPGTDQWVAVVLLKDMPKEDGDVEGSQPNEAAPDTQSRQTDEPPQGSREGRDSGYHDKTAGEQAVTRAGILAKDEAFEKWMKDMAFADGLGEPIISGADLIRIECDIDSRAALATNPEALQRFLALEEEYGQATGRRTEQHG